MSGYLLTAASDLVAPLGAQNVQVFFTVGQDVPANTPVFCRFCEWPAIEAEWVENDTYVCPTYDLSSGSNAASVTFRVNVGTADDNYIASAEPSGYLFDYVPRITSPPSPLTSRVNDDIEVELTLAAALHSDQGNIQCELNGIITEGEFVMQDEGSKYKCSISGNVNNVGGEVPFDILVRGKSISFDEDYVHTSANSVDSMEVYADNHVKVSLAAALEATKQPLCVYEGSAVNAEAGSSAAEWLCYPNNYVGALSFMVESVELPWTADAAADAAEIEIEERTQTGSQYMLTADTASLIAPLGPQNVEVFFSVGQVVPDNTPVYCRFCQWPEIEATLIAGDQYKCATLNLSPGSSQASVDFRVNVGSVTDSFIPSAAAYKMDYVPAMMSAPSPLVSRVNSDVQIEFILTKALGMGEVECAVGEDMIPAVFMYNVEGAHYTCRIEGADNSAAREVPFDVVLDGKSMVFNDDLTYVTENTVNTIAKEDSHYVVSLAAAVAANDVPECVFRDIVEQAQVGESDTEWLCYKPADCDAFAFAVNGELLMYTNTNEVAQILPLVEPFSTPEPADGLGAALENIEDWMAVIIVLAVTVPLLIIMGVVICCCVCRRPPAAPVKGQASDDAVVLEAVIEESKAGVIYANQQAAQQTISI